MMHRLLTRSRFSYPLLPCLLRSPAPGRSFALCIRILPLWPDRFRTPHTCFEPNLTVIAVSGDRPDRLAPGEPSLWRVLRERIGAPDAGATNAPGAGEGGGESHLHHRPVDLLLHAGGQSWMADAFEDAWELLKRRAMEPALCADGGWQEAQEEAAERLREVTKAVVCYALPN